MRTRDRSPAAKELEIEMTRLPQITDAGTEEAESWFEDGVRFRCLGPECGDCCSGKHGPGAVWLGREDLQRLASHFDLSVAELRRRYVRRLGRRASLRERANFDCIFYRAVEGCTVYEARPLQCRTYPFWGRILASPRTWELEAEKCPGIDADDTRVSAEEVRRRLRADAPRHK